MSVSISILIWVLTGAFLLAGLAGSVIPGLPGPPLVLAGVLVYGLATGFAGLGWPVLLALGFLAALSQVLDYLASVYGTKRFGGSKWGIWGSILGGLLGLLFFSLPGMIVGIFAGAVLPELLLGRKSPGAAFKVGGGSLLGFLGGTLLKLVFALVMIGIFLSAIFAQS